MVGGAWAHQTGTQVPRAPAHQTRQDVVGRLGYAHVTMRSVVTRLTFVLALATGLAACAAPAGSSFDPSGRCAADGRAPGAYPELEARIPETYRAIPPETLDSGRNCSTDGLGSLAESGIAELRFAGGTWSFGAERAVALAVFNAPGLEADQLADFYAASARTALRTEILAESRDTISGRPARRLDTKTGERLQTVVVWAAAEPDFVNVVISNDLPDARIGEAIAAFGDR